MTNKEIYDGISKIDEKYLDMSEKKPKNKKKALKLAIAFAVCLGAVLTGVIIMPKLYDSPEIIDGPSQETELSTETQTSVSEEDILSAFTVASPVIPEQLQFSADATQEQYSAYREENISRKSEYKTERSDFEEFFNSVSNALLTENDGKNKVLAPSNLYIALSLMMSATDGNTSKQILDVLGADSKESAENIANSLLMANYIDNGNVKSIISNSLWTGSKYTLYTDAVQALAQKYYASVFKGDASDSAYTDALHSWMNLSTNNMLNDSVENIKFTPEMALTIVSTEYLAGRWQNEFDPANNTEGTFRSAQGDETVTFMNSFSLDNCYYGKNYSAIYKSLYNDSKMFFILPDDGTSPEELIASGELNNLLLEDTPAVTRKRLQLHLALPKFDASSDFELSEQLQALGITDVFNCETADFSTLSPDKLYLSAVNHSARVKIDEEGVEASAFTEESFSGAGISLEDEVWMTFDRPFIFAVTGDTGDILFIGTVNTIFR